MMNLARTMDELDLDDLEMSNGDMDQPAVDAQTVDAENELKELASLARLVTFARERAHAVGAEFPAYCLDLALGAILQEVYKDAGHADMPVENRAAWAQALPN